MTQNKPSFLLPVLGVGVLALGGFSFYQNSQTQDLRRELAAHQQDVTALRTNLSTADSELQKTLSTLRVQMESTEEKSGQVIARAQAAAKRHADVLASNLEKKQRENQQTMSAELNAQITKVKETTDEANAKLSGIDTEVSSVKTEVASAKSDITKTLSDLQRVSGDLGVMSGLIATNSKEIGALRELGERNIYEFTLPKSDTAQRVGDIQIALKKADVKRNRYTISVAADDKLIEKKDKTTNEPVQFYVVSKSRIPYEIVVNEVSKNTIKGYLSTPKTSLARN